MLTLETTTLVENTFRWSFVKQPFKYRITYRGSPMLFSYAKDQDGNTISQIIQEGVNAPCDYVFDMEQLEITFTDMGRTPFTSFELLEIELIPV